MKERDDSKPIVSYVILQNDAYWGGKKYGGRRGRSAKTSFCRYLAELCCRFNRRFSYIVLQDTANPTAAF
ncbi:MAG TPA: hypothetical protein EYG88_03105 [Desulfocapsa sulfexigens]|nr:hypothetical protein [Desulfocapsa sulfexigens]